MLKFCPKCNRNVITKKGDSQLSGLVNLLYFMLTMCTFGFMILIWAVHSEMSKPCLCKHCGGAL
jgi:hypothetical protein